MSEGSGFGHSWGSGAAAGTTTASGSGHSSRLAATCGLRSCGSDGSARSSETTFSVGSGFSTRSGFGSGFGSGFVSGFAFRGGLSFGSAGNGADFAAG